MLRFGVAVFSDETMGCVQSRERSVHVGIEKELDKERLSLNRNLKVLMLGSGESGKSTLLKQLRIVNHNAFSEGVDDDERYNFREVVRGNCVECVQALIKASISLNLPIESTDNRQRAARVQLLETTDAYPADNSVEAELLQADLVSLWKDAGIRKLVLRKREFQLLDSCEYLLDSLPRITAPSYSPTRQDIIKSRVKTTGIIETEFEHNSFKYKVVDVGGQRNERRKWAHVFEGISALMFVTALSEIGEKLYEENSTPRVKESLEIFKQLTHSRWFQHTPVLFRKVNTFAPKIPFGEKGDARTLLHKGAKETSIRTLARKQGIKKAESFLLRASKCPPKTDENCWLAMKAVELVNLTSAIYGAIQDHGEICTEETCEKMTAGPKFLFLWQDAKSAQFKEPTQVSSRFLFHSPFLFL